MEKKTLFSRISDLIGGNVEVRGVEADDLGMGFRPLGGGTDSSPADIARTMPGLTFPILDLLISDFATIKLKLVETDKDGDSELLVHPALTSLKRPSKGKSQYHLFGEYMAYMMTAGVVFWYVPRVGATAVRKVITLNPFLLKEIKYDAEGSPLSYTFRNGSGEITYTAEEVIMDKLINPIDLGKVFSPLSPVAESVDASEGAMKYNKRFFQNDATPSLLIKIKKALSDEAKKRFKINWLNQFRGADNAHKFALSDADIDVTPLGASMKDMAFKDLNQVTDQRIMSNWKINKVLLGQTENVNRSTIEGAELNHARRVLRPRFEQFVSFLDSQFLPLFVSEVEIDRRLLRFEFENPVSDDMELLANVANKGTGGKAFMTVNEARELIHLEALDGDEYDELPKAPVTTPQEDDGNKPQEDNQDSDEGKQLRRLLDTKNDEIGRLKAEFKNLETYDLYQKIKRLELGAEHLVRALNNEPRVRALMIEFFNGQEKRILSSIQKVGEKGVGGHEEKLWSWALNSKEEEKLLRELVKDLFFMLAKTYWEEADKNIAGTLPYDEAELTRFVESSLIRFSQEVNQTTLDELNAFMVEANNQGYGIDKIKKFIKERFVEYRKNRAETIARTEVNGIANGMSDMRYKIALNDGVISGLEWLTTMDGKQRDIHGDANGQVIGVGEQFTVGGEKMNHPGDVNASASNRINCRCTVIPVL